MLLHDQDDAFSCGGASPIRHRFSMDAGSSLEGSDGGEEEDKERRDGARDFPDHRGNTVRNCTEVDGGNDSEEGNSRFLYRDDENDNVSFGGGGGNDDGYTQQCPGTQQQQQQLSQWNAFRNADARLTHSDRTATTRIPERRIRQCGGGPYATGRSRSGPTL